MIEPAIKVEGVSKEYLVGAARQQPGTFYDLLSRSMSAPLTHLRSLRRGAAQSERFLALRDINFEIQRGEVVGVIGRNGAGKSTLLKILSRIAAPTLGRIEVRGRLASLLEVGTGFHPELSGRENIFLNGAILGMSRREVAQKFDEIVAFAEVDRFIDTPVKRYSSGMYVRLAFAVAAHLDVDVLVVDEVLAVGDTAFQAKCLDRMGDLSSGGRTILFVSHNLGAISRLCSRGLVLHEGAMVFDGSPGDALAHYGSMSRQNLERHAAASVVGPLADKLALCGVTINGSGEVIGQVFKPDLELVISIAGESVEPLRDFRVTLCLFKGEQLVLGMHDAPEPCDLGAGRFTSVFTLPALFLSPGDYAIDINLYSSHSTEWMLAKSFVYFSISTQWHSLYEPTHGMGIVNLPISGVRTMGA